MSTPTSFSVFAPDEAKGGQDIVPATTALVCIEFQSEFTTDGMKLYDGVKDVMQETSMLQKTAELAKAMRAAGGTVIHVPITFKEDASDNPNKRLGILADCATKKLFTAGKPNAKICGAMEPMAGDPIVIGKKGLDAFPNTTLEAELKAAGIETVALCGFLTNCCVESTMRTACEKGYNVVTVTDCCAAMGMEAHTAAIDGTFGMFSTPMTAEELTAKLPALETAPAPAPRKKMEPPRPSFAVWAPKTAKGGNEIVRNTTALVCIEFQNEFVHKEGKLNGGVKEVMQSTNMLANTMKLAQDMRTAGVKVIHVPISFAEDASDNPNKGLGILKGCASDKLFTSNTWNSEFCEEMKPQDGDVVVRGKKGLDAFPNTTLEAELIKAKCETVAICGFLTNCCVESTMRTACEKGFNVVTVTNCCASMSQKGHDAAINGTFTLFSTPMTAEELTTRITNS